MLKNLNCPIPNINIYASSPEYKERYVRWTGAHTLNAHTFYYVLNGSFVLNINDIGYIVRKNQMALLPANQPHAYWLTPDNNMQALVFSFRAETGGEDLLEFFGCTQDNHVVSLPEKEVVACYKAMTQAESMVEIVPHHITFHAQTGMLLSLYIHARIRLENATTAFSAVVEYMRNHLNEDVALETLSAIMHISPIYFCNKFKTAVGLSPMQYFAQLRALEAARLLKTTDMSLKAIAATVGMQDVYYFKTFFYKHIGVRPELYREIFDRPENLC